MNTFLVAASLLLALVGLIHTVLGERLIFRHLRVAGVVASAPAGPLRERHVRILWATWHAVTALGWGMSLILLQLARSDQATAAQTNVLWWVISALLLSSALVALGTRWRHPGWIGLLLVAVLTAMGLPG